jgi:hypothetical protein
MNRLVSRQKLRETETARMALCRDSEERNEARQQPDTTAVPAEVKRLCEQILRFREIVRLQSEVRKMDQSGWTRIWLTVDEWNARLR